MREALQVQNNGLLALDSTPLPLYDIPIPSPLVPGERLPLGEDSWPQDAWLYSYPLED